jgi:hypothetical protein
MRWRPVRAQRSVDQGVRTGWAIEPRYKRNGVPTRSDKAEGNIVGGVIREPLAGPARSLEPGHVRELSMRENREIRRSPVLLVGAGRAGKAEAVIP